MDQAWKTKPTKWLILRAHLCEMLFEWSMNVCPENYVPSYTQALMDEMKKDQ